MNEAVERVVDILGLKGQVGELWSHLSQIPLPLSINEKQLKKPESIPEMKIMNEEFIKILCLIFHSMNVS